MIWDAHLAVLPAKAQLAAINAAFGPLRRAIDQIGAAAANSMRPLVELRRKLEGDCPAHPRGKR